MNKIVNHRYSSVHQLPSNKSQKREKVTSNNSVKARHSHAATQLLKKQSQIQMVKKRISALCVRQQKYANRSVNADWQMEKRDEVQKESMRIQRLLDEQRKREANKLDLLKYRNLQSRADGYFKVKLVRKNQVKEVQQRSQNIRNKSKEYHNAISQQRSETISSRQRKTRSIYQHTRQIQNYRDRFLQTKREEALKREDREAEHLEKLEEIKDYQLNELGKLEMMMVEKSNTSRAVYESKRKDLSSRMSKNRLETHSIIKSARQRKPSSHSFSLNLY